VSSYALVFRTPRNVQATAEDEAAWGAWFQGLGGAVSDYGHRVGQASMLGAESALGLAGYVVLTADDMSHASELAKGCPGLQTGGTVEIGEIVDAA
jgi:hypothetical protein